MVNPARGHQRAIGKRCGAGTAEVAKSGVVGAERCCWAGGPGSASDTMFDDAGYLDEGPLGLWESIRPGIWSLSSTDWGKAPMYELRFRHPNLPARTTHTILPGHYQEVIVCYACMQNLPDTLGISVPSAHGSSQTVTSLRYHLCSSMAGVRSERCTLCLQAV